MLGTYIIEENPVKQNDRIKWCIVSNCIKSFSRLILFITLIVIFGSYPLLVTILTLFYENSASKFTLLLHTIDTVAKWFSR